METILDRLKEALEADQTVVFPSEVAARAWREHLVTCVPGITAVRNDRMISWDQAKQQLFPRNAEAVPASSVHRAIFSSLCTAENIDTAFLRFFIPKDYSENSSSFSSGIRTLLPVLPEILRGSEGISSLQEMHADAEALIARYTHFLDRNGLFEPSYIPEIIDPRSDSSYLLFFPDTIRDWYSINDQLAASDAVQTFTVADLEDRDLPLHTYENSTCEIASALDHIEQQLRLGLRAEDIVITAADLDGIHQDLLSAARLRGIPLHIRSGRMLSEFPVSGIFGDIASVVDQRFSLSSMKHLLLSRSYRWKNRKLHRRLISAGVSSSCLKNYRRADGTPVDIWEKMLGRYQDKSLLNYYRALRDQLQAIVRASELSELSRELQSFQFSFLQPYEDASSEAGSVFSYCIEQLQRLIRAAEFIEFSHPIPVYRLYLQLIDQTRYVAQASSGGISVYPYGVSAGICPPLHLLLGMDQAHTSVDDDPLRMLSEQQRQLMQSAVESTSEQLLGLYMHSGDQVRCSCSRRDRTGAQLPSYRFIERQQILEEQGASSQESLYAAEQSFWHGDADKLQRVYQLQLQGFSYADRVLFRRPSFSITHHKASEAIRSSQLDRVTNEDGYLVVSPTSLDLFLSCPFSWYAEHILKIREVDYDVQYTDARAIGILIHRCYEQLFKEIEVYHAEDTNDHAQRLSEIIDTEFSRFMGRADAPPEAASVRIREFLESHVPLIIPSEVMDLDGWETYGLEKTLRSVLEQERILIEGRIDRISVQPPGRMTAVIDYKKQCRVKPSSFSSDAVQPDSYQLPIYAYLIEDQEPGTKEVSHALYYDVTKGSYVKILPYHKGKLVIDRERFEEVIDDALEQIRTLGSSLRSGDAMPCRSRSDQCERCSFRDICRGRFSIR